LGVEIESGFPFRGKSLEKLRAFLGENGLKYDERVEFSVCAIEGDEIAAAGSLDGNVLKCVAVSQRHQNEGLAALIVTELVKEAARKGVFHLFLFTKPQNATLFGSLGFYLIAKTDDVLLLENKKHGVSDFVSKIQQSHFVSAAKQADVPANSGNDAGAVVMNCNPFTKGHQFLVEEAAKRCSFLYIFVVSENKSAFPADVRFRLAQAGAAHIPNARVFPTGPYLVSSATFPDYFFKETVKPKEANTLLDITVFAECFAAPLGIVRRFAGTEPFDALTAGYNRAMTNALPGFGIEFVEIPRLEREGEPISASRVRLLLKEGRLEETRALVPESTYEWLGSSV
jgi:[citrate (pro-3S)-lyase] ligase